MNTLVQNYLVPTGDLQFSCHSKKSVFPQENHVAASKQSHGFHEYPVNKETSPAVDESSSEEESFAEVDHSDAIFKFINQMLMEEEDLENKPCMLQDCLALQATEKYLYDVLNNNLDETSDTTSATNASEKSSDVNSFDFDNHDQGDLGSCISPSLSTSETSLESFSGSSLWKSNSANESWKLTPSIFNDEFVRQSSESTADLRSSVERNDGAGSANSLKEKKNRGRDNVDSVEQHRSSKQLAHNVGEMESLELFDKVLLCPNLSDRQICDEVAISEEKKKKKKKSPRKEESKGSSRGRLKGGKNQETAKEVVDLRSLLMQCAQAVAIFDRKAASDLLVRIRSHSSPHGDGNERVAHYFANALEARLAGTGTELYAAYSSMMISAAMILKAYQTFITACPFRKMSNMFANQTIRKLAAGASRIHIIDFGILYGFQWPCLIQALSERAAGPPMLRITGIDFPQPGFRPAERVKDTGDRLARYCKRFNVPFEYTPFAQKWETIRVEDLKIDRTELLVINSLYRLLNVPDETVTVNCPRDVVLNLINSINPDLFIHGVVNGTYNTPFFITRYREALFHFSSMFDMFEASVPREDPDRLLFEEQKFGKEVMSIIACEGTERVERPETYKQWQSRNIRAGLRQIPLDQEIVKRLRTKVKREYHKDFSVDEDGMWMLQGWKGRVLHGLSCWIPAHK